MIKDCLDGAGAGAGADVGTADGILDLVVETELELMVLKSLVMSSLVIVVGDTLWCFNDKRKEIQSWSSPVIVRDDMVCFTFTSKGLRCC